MTTQQRITTTKAFADVESFLNDVPATFLAELIAELRRFEPQLLARAKSGVPARSGPRPEKFAASRPGRRPSGGLVSLITAKVEPDARRLSVGLLTPQARADGFYGFILDGGRGLKRTRSRPRQREIAGPATMGRFGLRQRETRRYTRAISPIQPGTYDITFGRVRQFARDKGGPMMRDAYNRMLSRLGWAKLTGRL